MKTTTLTRNQWEALRSLLDELDNIEDTRFPNPLRFAVDGNLSKDNLNVLRPLVDLERID